MAADARADVAYRSPVPYEASRINAAALCCSDGRIGDHVDDFLHVGLGLPRYDRVACPGGPAALAGRLMAFWEARGVDEQLRFLVRAHSVRQVLLIGHEGCAYYIERLGFDAASAAAEQRRDLAMARDCVKRIDAGLEIAAYFAHLDGDGVWFERVFAGEALDERVRQAAAWVRPSAGAVVVPARKAPPPQARAQGRPDRRR